MNSRDPDQWEEEVETLIQELIESGLLTGELEAEIESLLVAGYYCSAGRLAVMKDRRPNTHAD